MHTYLTVCIAECLGLLIGNVWVDRIAAFGIGGARLCGPIFLMLRGSLASAATWVGSFCVAQFVLEGHDIVRIDHLHRWVRSTSRSTCSRRDFADERVKCCRGNSKLALDHRGCRCWGHGLIVVRVIDPGDLRLVQEFTVRAYSTIVRCHAESRTLKTRARPHTFYTFFKRPNSL